MSHRENTKPEAGLSRENLVVPALVTDEGEAVSGIIGATAREKAAQQKAARMYRCAGCGSTSDPCLCGTHGV